MLDLFDDRRLQLHGTKPIDLAVDIVTVGAVDQADIAYLGADLDGLGLSLDLQVFHDSDGVAVAQDLTNRILDDFFLWLFHDIRFSGPLMGALGAHQQGTHFVCIGA